MDITNPTLLLVDDDAGFTRAASYIAQSLGIEACIAATAAEARQQLQQARFDLALVDLSLPDGQGADLLPRCAERCNRVLVVSGAPSGSLAVNASGIASLDYLLKPLDPARYLSLLESLFLKAQPPRSQRSEAYRPIIREIAGP